jgi:hypothetical protein
MRRKDRAIGIARPRLFSRKYAPEPQREPEDANAVANGRCDRETLCNGVDELEHEGGDGASEEVGDQEDPDGGPGG